MSRKRTQPDPPATPAEIECEGSGQHPREWRGKDAICPVCRARIGVTTFGRVLLHTRWADS